MNGAMCNFCGREFANAQAVRAHLRACEAYRARSQAPAAVPRESLGEYAPDPDAIDQASMLARRVEAERVRLQLREVEAQHRGLDAEEERVARREQEAEVRARVGELARAQALERERLCAERMTVDGERERKREAARRSAIQQAKDTATRWDRLRPEVTEEALARALRGIEEELSRLPVEELPPDELVSIARGVAERAYRPFQEEHERVKRRLGLVEYGITYAESELVRDGVPWLDRSEIKDAVRDKLEHVLGGDETQHDVRVLVDAAMDEELGEDSDGEDEDERRDGGGDWGDEWIGP